MNEKRYSAISAKQAGILVMSYILADITMERGVGEEMQTPDVWLAVLVGGIIILIAGWICAALSRRYPGKSFFMYNSEIVGKPIGFLLSLAFIGYNLMVASFALRMHAEYTRYFLLERTPIEVTIAVSLAIGTYIMLGGINPVTKLAEFFTPLTLVAFMVIWTLSVKNFDAGKLLPIMSEGMNPVWKGSIPTILGYAGFDSILVYASFMKEPHKAVKAVTIGVAVCILFYIVNAVMVIGYMGVEEVTTVTWPSMELVESISFFGGFFENFELLMIGVWIVLIFLSYQSAHFIANFGFTQLLNINKKIIHVVLVVFIYVLSLIPPDINRAFEFGTITGYVAVITGALVPFFLLLVALAKERRYEK